jgi:hypothetical protein
MADRHISPKQHRTLAANAALFVVAAIVAAPALAATSSRIPCSEAVEVTLNIAVASLITETVGHNIPAPSITGESSIDEISVVSSTSLLVPRAEEAIRDAFAESDSATVDSPVTELSNAVLSPPMAGTESKAETAETDDNETAPGMNTKLPGISDDAMLRYKKQMFRRDI